MRRSACSIDSFMPTPLGHALGAAAAGWAVAPPVSRLERAVILRQGIWFAILGMFPDLDLVWGLHRGPTHSVGAALIAGLAVAAGTRMSSSFPSAMMLCHQKSGVSFRRQTESKIGVDAW